MTTEKKTNEAGANVETQRKALATEINASIKTMLEADQDIKTATVALETATGNFTDARLEAAIKLGMVRETMKGQAEFKKWCSENIEGYAYTTLRDLAGHGMKGKGLEGDERSKAVLDALNAKRAANAASNKKARKAKSKATARTDKAMTAAEQCDAALTTLRQYLPEATANGYAVPLNDLLALLFKQIPEEERRRRAEEVFDEIDDELEDAPADIPLVGNDQAAHNPLVGHV